MKKKAYILTALIALFLSGCVVFSFYPLYTEKDLFPNDILIGEWYENDPDLKSGKNEILWKFEHPYKLKSEKNTRIDSCKYVLTYTTIDNGDTVSSEFSVHIIKLQDVYFLDFYLEEGPKFDGLSSIHLVPTHTFAKLSIINDTLTFNWFDSGWLENLIKENKIRIRHEQSDGNILLTAKPKELQKFVSKYVNSEDAFRNGLSVGLVRKAPDTK
ncbi:MAG: hypothetical protein ACK5HT_07685 [Draconibacterium sp.]